jgi:DNA-damage-inducible protein J
MDDTKKKLQANVDKEADEEARAVLDRLGLNMSTIVNALIKRIAAEGKVPFSLELTDEELLDLRLSKAVSDAHIPVLHGKKAVADYLTEDEDDDY